MPQLALALVLVTAPAATARADPDFAEVDREMRAYMELVRCQAAAVAIGRDGKLLHSRGFGHRDRERKAATPADALFRIGSITKPITAALVKELARAGKLDLDDKVLDVLEAELIPRGRFDPRLRLVTVAQLLEHKGGWDARRSFDPVFQHGQAQKELRLRRPCTASDIVRWMLPRALDFDPGSRVAYSNLGYCVLGRIVEKASGKSFSEALADGILNPWKIEDIRVGRTLPRDRPEREVWYPVTDALLSLEVMDSCAGLTASAPALCEFLHRYWLNGDRRRASTVGRWVFHGSLQGTTALANQRLDGVNVVALFNNRRDRTLDADQAELLKKLTAAVDRAVKE